MCVICYKPRGQHLPSDTTIATMFHRNPDGAGFMWWNENENAVSWRKGFFTLDDFMRALQEQNFSRHDMIALHFRIATSGGINAGRCHPFPVTQNLDYMTSASGTDDAVFMHNGVIGVGTAKLSDTMIYIYRHADLIKGIKSNSARCQVEADTIGSRTLTFMDGKAFRTGQWIHDGGRYYSNYSFNNSLNRTYGFNKNVRKITYRFSSLF